MDLPIVGQVQHAAYSPTEETPPYLPSEAWSAPVAVDTHGWWPPTSDQILGVEPGRRAEEIERALLIPQGTDCGDRDRWTLPGDGIFEQVAGPQDYSHGPFGTQVPLIAYLKRVEG